MKLRRVETKARAPRFPHLGKNVVIVLALLGAGFFAAWLRFRPYLGEEGNFSDGARTFDPSQAGAVRYAVWQAPERLDDSINAGAHESRPAISPDGRWFVFAVGERGTNAELYIAEMRDGKPVDPKPLAALDTASDECSPAFASDALYFASDRPGGSGGLDLYRAPYADGGFGEAERLGGEINSDQDDCDPAPCPGTGEIVFASNRAGGGFRLYTSQPDPSGGAPTATAIASLASTGEEREPAFTADGRTLFFASNRGKAPADFDLYRSNRLRGTWSTPVPLDGLNTLASERAPLPAFDDFSIYFERSAASGDSGLMRARSSELFRLPGRPIGWVDVSILAALLVLGLLAWLAKTFPRWHTIYKCYFASVVAHALLFWWFHGVLVGGGAPGRGYGRGESDEIRFQVTPSFAGFSTSSGLPVGGGRGGGGGGRGGARGPGSSSDEAPERFSSGVDATGEPAIETAALEVPSAREPEVPGREGGAPLAQPIPTASVPLASGSGVVRRIGSAPSLELASAAGEVSRTPGGPSSPARGTGIALSDPPGEPGAPGSPPGSLGGIAAPSERADGAPARIDAVGAPFGGIVGARTVAVAGPSAERGLVSGGGSQGMSIDGLGLGGGGSGTGGRAAAGAPGRGGGSLGDPGASPSSGWVASLAPTAPESPGGQGGAGLDPAAVGPGDGAHASVALHDAEKPGKPVTASAPKSGGGNGPGGSGDLLDALAGPATKSRGGGGGGGGGAPEKQSFGSGGGDAPAASAPAPIALAMPGPDERPRGEPDKPEKRWENTPYRNREGEQKTHALELNGGTPETEAAVANGLAYLARIQRASGGWGDEGDVDGKYGQIAVGKTGLALLAFLGAGHTHASKTRFSDNAGRAINFLLSMQDESSGHFGDSEAYSHGIATYALAECYALTREPVLREPLERAVAHILSKQNHAKDPKRFGGWSYYYTDDRTYDRWPRSSITAWQVMALESARLAGLDVPEKVFEDAAAFLQNAEDPDEGYFRYNHDPSRLSSAWPTLPASTPAALFALSLAGRDIGSDEFARAREFVLSRTPRGYRRGSDDDFVRRGQGNLYFWYYGTLAMFRTGGNAWQRWNAAMKDTLVSGQRKDGSWAPIDVYCSYARDDERDRSYSTAMCVLSLEVYYRYYLPLLKIH